MTTEQTLDIQNQKVYKDRTIWVGSFLGGPLTAGYLIAENFKTFGETDKTKKAWFYTIIATIIIFGGVFLIPEDFNVPNIIIPLIYSAIAYFIVQHFQGANIKEHIRAGGRLFTWWRTIGISIVGLLITAIPIFGIALLSSESISNASLTTKTYGIMKHEIAFNQSNISEREVDKIADGLIRTTFFDEAKTKYVVAEKVGNGYELSISVVDGVATNPQALQHFIALKTDLQKFFPNNKIILELIVGNLDNVIKRIE